MPRDDAPFSEPNPKERPSAARDPLESLLRKGEMLDLDLEGDVELPSAKHLETRRGLRASETGVISLGIPESLPIGDDSMDTLPPHSSRTTKPTTLDGGEIATNISFADNKRFRIRRELGRGGMATVYDAVDLDLRRHVAIKVLHDEHRRKAERGDDSEDRSALQRFVEEAQITGQLEHPNIVPVHEIGRDAEGRIYFAMKRVEGGSLASILEKMRAGDEKVLQRYGIFELCEIFVKICDAIGFAHSRKVIHRDLKPDNIMVGRFGEVQVMDWGLAKLLGSPEPSAASTDSTQTFTGRVSTITPGKAVATIEGTISGTPAYMPPEQARGEIARIDERSDVFMLGGILYELITLVPPYHAESSLSALLRAQKHDLAEPRRAVEDMAATMKLPDGSPVVASAVERARRFPAELASIAMKALSESPADRYQTPQELAREIERYLKREPISVHRYHVGERLEKWVARNRVKSSMIAAILVMSLLSAAIVSWLLKDRAERAREHNDALYAAEQSAATAEQRRLREAADRLSDRVRAAEFINLGSDLVRRIAEIRDADAVHEARLESVKLFTRAIDENPSDPEPHRLRAEIQFDMGRLDSGIADIEAAKRKAVEEGLRPNPASMMAGGMALITKGMLRIENEQVWTSQFTELMSLVQQHTEEGSDYHVLASVLEEAMQVLDGKTPIEKARDQMVALGERLQRLLRPNQRLWEVYLFSAWFESFGWTEATEAGQQAIRRGREVVERALALKPNLPLALLFRDQTTVMLDALEARGVGAIGRPTREDMVRIHDALNKQSAPRIMQWWDEYVAAFPHDPMGHYLRGTLPSRMAGMDFPGLTPESRRSSLERAMALTDSQPMVFTALAQLAESSGDFAAAAVHLEPVYSRAAAAKDFVSGNWIASLPSLTPTIRYVRVLIQAGRPDDALAVLKTIRETSGHVRALYSEHFHSALMAWYRHGESAAVPGFVTEALPQEPTVSDMVRAAQALIRRGHVTDAGEYRDRARLLAESKGSSIPDELKELSRTYDSHVSLLNEAVSRPMQGRPPHAVARSIERTRELSEEERAQRWLAVLHDPTTATVNELYSATVHYARKLGQMSEEEERALVAKKVVEAWHELNRTNPRMARGACSACDELKALVERSPAPTAATG